MKRWATTILDSPRGGKCMFEYEATQTSPHRAAPKVSIKNSDDELSRNKRKIASATTLDEVKNGALLAWMIRRHIDYVSRFEINFRSGNAALDEKVHSLLAWHRRRANWEKAGRLNRDDWMRIFEFSKVTHGDAAGIKLADGKIQGLNSDQIAKPDDWGDKKPNQKMIERVSDHGLILDKQNGVEKYCICYRNKEGRLIFDHFEDAENILFDGYFTAFNQTRAPSPLIAAINDVIDMRDIVLYTKINLKLKNLFAIAMFRDTADPLGGHTEDDDEDIAESGQEQQLTPDRINLLDLDAADKVQSIESQSPSPNAMEFMFILARISMLALDIPFTALDSSKASFSARIADRAEYEESCESKRDKNADVLRDIYTWKFEDWYANDEEFRGLADAAKYPWQKIVDKLDFMPAGTPWMDKLTEIKADILSVSLGIESIPRIARRHGLDAYAIGKEQAEYLAWAKENNLPIFYASGGQQAVQSILDEKPSNTNSGNNADSNGDNANE